MKCEYCDALLEEGMTQCPVCGKELLVVQKDAVEEENTNITEQEGEMEEKIEETSVECDHVEESAEDEADEESPADDEAAEEDDAEEDDAEEDDAEEDDECEVTEEVLEKKIRPAWWKILLLCVGVLAAVILFVALILKDQGVDINPAHWFGSSAVARESDYPLTRKNYTAKERGIQKQTDAVVAENGDMQLNNGQLQIFYWTGVYEFINQYQYYLQGMGLDIYQPLNEQYTTEGLTWQQFFIENALYNWHKYSSLALQAKAEGFEISEEKNQQLEELAANLETLAQTNGFASADEMITKELGPLCDMQSYQEYMRTYYLAVEYFNAKYEEMKPTDAQVEEYFTANEEALAQAGITKETKIYGVRHILIEPEGGTEDENGEVTYSDEEWEACREKAQQMLDTWLEEDGTEDGFATLATENSADTGSTENGGLYSELNESTNFVQEFKDWYLDTSRKVGDTGLVKSVYGYHIMYLSSAENNWYTECYNALLTNMSEQLVQDCMAAWPITMNDRKIAIGTVTFEAQ